MDLGLKDKYAIVTGSTGICKATAMSLAKEGVNVAVTYLSDVDKTTSELTVKNIKEMGLKSLNLKMNLLSLKNIKSMVSRVIEDFGRIDILINCAGAVHASLVEDITEEVWDLDFDIDLKGLFFCCKEVFNKAMKAQKSGKIVNVASVAGIRPVKNYPSYCAAKSGVINITRYLAVEWGQYNIRVNSVSPGWIATELLLGRINKGLSMDPSLIMPIGRLGTAEEIADLITFIVSNKNDFMTGTNVVSDGGILTGIRIPFVKNNQLEVL